MPRCRRSPTESLRRVDYQHLVIGSQSPQSINWFATSLDVLVTRSQTQRSGEVSEELKPGVTGKSIECASSNPGPACCRASGGSKCAPATAKPVRPRPEQWAVDQFRPQWDQDTGGSEEQDRQVVRLIAQRVAGDTMG